MRSLIHHNNVYNQQYDFYKGMVTKDRGELERMVALTY
jgi:hypothetical protein